MARIAAPLFVLFVCFVVPLLSSFAATFPGNARIHVTDPTGGLSWSNSINAISVSCWFKISLPTGQTLSEDMVILADRRTGDENERFAYLIKFNIFTGNVEFHTRGANGLYSNTLIQFPYLERWYHIAVVRDGESVTGYVDGRQVFSSSPTNIGDASNSDGASIGGWSGRHLWGEVQEVAIYQAALSHEFITEYMFQGQPAVPDLKGYYKLGYSTNAANHLKNFAPTPPPSTDPATVISSGGQVKFEEVNEAGEQSAFDSKKNRGDDAITPLSGAFSWGQTVFSRATPGVALDLRIGYSSANQVNGFKLGNFDPFASSTLGNGWRHSFETRVLPSQYFAPVAGIDTLGVMAWDGGVETWDLDVTNNVYKTRHNEYRGELALIGGFCDWTTPDRLVYRFKHPFSGSSIMRGRLLEIRDFNGNAVKVNWDQAVGVVTQVVDTVGGTYDFHYNPQYQVTNVTFQGWAVNFQYDSESRLTNKFLVGPAAYTNLNTRWSFTYTTATNGPLRSIIDPRGNTNSVVYYDKYGRVTNSVDALSRSTQTEYNVPDKLRITRTDPAGFKWIEAYDRRGRPTEKKDPLGNATAYTYDSAGNVKTMTEPMGWVTSYEYDTRANVLTNLNALGQVRTWTYHAFYNKPLTETDPLGWVTRYEYDPAGNLLRHFDDLGTLVLYSYTTNGLVQTSSDANGHSTSFSYNSDGFLTSKTDPASKTWTYTRNELGWMMSEQNPLSQVTTYSYDVNGNVVQTVDPLPRTYTKSYDPNGNLLSQSDGKGKFTLWSYDAANQKTQMVDRVSAKWTYAYTSRGEILTTIDPLNNVVSNAYDNANRLISVTDPLGGVTKNEYDANGKVIATIDKLDRRWSKTYDRLNRVIAESDPLGNIKQTAYDAAGRIQTITTPNGYPSTHEYDGRGRLEEWTDAEGFLWKYAYDGVGNITNITDALNGHYIMEYGPRNERTLERNQDGKEWQYTYDELVRLKIQTDPNGTTRTLTYDAGGRLTSVSFNTGRVNSLGYDNNNNPINLTRTVSGVPTISLLSYDDMDRVTQYQDAFSKTVGYSYDALGRLSVLTYPGTKTLTHAYDSLGRLTNQVDWAGRQLGYSYDKANRLVGRTYPNGVTQTNAFDNAGRLTSLEYRITNSTPIALSYAYDRNGNKASFKEKGTFKWPQPSMHDETAQYTPAGRLIDKLDAGVASNNWMYAYDPSGNMTNAVGAGQSFALTYDEDNRVMTVNYDVLPLTSKVIQNRYDALGRRISRTLDGVETQYLLDLSGSLERILCDADGGGTIAAYYIHGPDLCYKVDASNNVFCYHSDAQANIIAITDTNATTVAQYAYTPYGRSLGSSQLSALNPQPYLFVGSQGVMEELPGLYFMRARYYSADAGVFLSTDPVKHTGPGWKPIAYAYVDGNPLSNIDPRGEFLDSILYGYDLANYGVKVREGQVDWLDRYEMSVSTFAFGVGLAIVAGATAPAWAGPALGVAGLVAFGSSFHNDWQNNEGLPRALRERYDTYNLHGGGQQNSSSLLPDFSSYSTESQFRQSKDSLTIATPMINVPSLSNKSTGGGTGKLGGSQPAGGSSATTTAKVGAPSNLGNSSGSSLASRTVNSVYAPLTLNPVQSKQPALDMRNAGTTPIAISNSGGSGSKLSTSTSSAASSSSTSIFRRAWNRVKSWFR